MVHRQLSAGMGTWRQTAGEMKRQAGVMSGALSRMVKRQMSMAWEQWQVRANHTPQPSDLLSFDTGLPTILQHYIRVWQVWSARCFYHQYRVRRNESITNLHLQHEELVKALTELELAAIDNVEKSDTIEHQNERMAQMKKALDRKNDEIVHKSVENSQWTATVSRLKDELLNAKEEHTSVLARLEHVVKDMQKHLDEAITAHAREASAVRSLQIRLAESEQEALESSNALRAIIENKDLECAKHREQMSQMQEHMVSFTQARLKTVL